MTPDVDGAGAGRGGAVRRLVLADDSMLFRSGLARLLEGEGYEIVGQARDTDELMALVDRDRPDVAIIDIKMPPSFVDEGLRAAAEIRVRHRHVGVLILSQYVEVHYAMKLIEEQPAGAGYLVKDRVTDLEDFLDAIQRVGRGGSVVDPGVVAELLARRRARDPLGALTDREREVLSLMAEGRSNEGIRARLVLSARTVEAHIRSIFMKLGLDDSRDDHRRVLAVLTFLRSDDATSM
jgi:DNA-binding NarL/FixJ family response regulator